MTGIGLAWQVQWLGAGRQAFLDVLGFGWFCFGFGLICIIYVKGFPNKLKLSILPKTIHEEKLWGFFHNQIRLWPSSMPGTHQPTELR